MNDFNPFYVWPHKYFPFRHYFQDEKLNIFIIENVVHNFNWLNKYKSKINDNHFFFVYCGWYMDNHHADHYDGMFKYLGLNKNNFFFLFNSQDEKSFLEKKGFKGEIINHNCWLNEEFLKPERVEKIYDAILISRRSEFKRHFLANKVNNLALVAGGNNYDPKDLSYPMPNHVYNNNNPLNQQEICTKINQSHCGLILSAVEGACFSSSEYLLCGIPVVSTKSLGGRDLWYDEYNSIICEDNEESVRAGVEFFKNNPRDATLIRERHIELADKQRKIFINILKNIFDKYGIKVDANEYFRNNYFHKMRDVIHEYELDKIFKNYKI